MADIINSNDDNLRSNIMRELSTIKASLAVGTSETVNIKESIAEIKIDIKEIKTGYVSFNQYQILTDCTADHEIRLRDNLVEIDLLRNNITKIMTWGSALVVLAGIVEFLINKYY